MSRAIVLTNGLLVKNDAKTAHGLIRGTERFEIIGVVDCPETAGKDAGVILDGKHRNIPVFADFQEAIDNLKNIETLVIGVATVGGVLPKDMFQIIRKAIKTKISIVNGLHEYLNEKPELVELADFYGVSLTDVRRPKKREDLSFWTGDIFKVKSKIIAVMGMDCAMGKRTTARMLTQMCKKNTMKAEMVYTGQTGWLQGGKYGFIFDATLNDFVSGELENAIVSAWKETEADFIFLEGQSSLRNPSGPCGFEYLISGNAKFVVLLHSPKRKYFDDDEHWGEIPSVESEIELIEKLGSKVIALALHTEKCSDAEAIDFQKYYEEKLKIPVLLPIQEGVEKLLPVLKALK
ncbi:MAG: DUF1611 domain-containing protein [Cytophagaceae bacterium]|nr:DUF1611 domain-containing protein [Cytophagaceae bacterium]MBK9932751.1 DUF1611 domain-containing protein [Cytophagaceae bacterium]MBL0303560.1 DUF1611 domain-containing protein [Cytophagaceae bacterium]MBL0326388.1 DUF1611 domain-containing protein [Cytophagaceae bacterium]